MKYKEITFSNEAREKVKAGIDKAAEAVKPTLGAVGMTAIIDWEGLDPIISDDGVTILKNLEFKDKYENMGLKMLRKAAVRTSTEGGDGTATTTILTQAILNEAIEALEGDSSKVQDIRQRLIKGLEFALQQLSKIKREVTIDDIERIANISSLDEEVSKLIAEVIKEVGVNGIITVEKSSTLGYSKDVVKGMRFDKGLISPYFINNQEKGECVLENPYIFLANRKISTDKQIASLMTSIQKTENRSVLIIADDVDGLALASLIQNNSTVTTQTPQGIRQGSFNIACVRNPYTASRAIDFLFDLASLTGATVINEEAGMKLDLATVEQCGMAEKVIITKDNCTIIGGKTPLSFENNQLKSPLQERISSIELKIKETTSEYEREMLEERLACLTGGIGVIRVGAYTDTEYNSKKLKFDNAINSTQAALQEGILPGGGTALLRVSEAIEDPIFRVALKVPFYQQATNAGMKVEANFTDGDGINFATKEKVNMFDAGIIDPFKVVRLALESAVAITSNLITCETAIVDIEDENK